MRVHVGAGTVYLTPAGGDGWLNVGLRAPGVHLASARPDLVEKWKTTDDAYYARHADKDQKSLRDAAVTVEEVCDAYGSFERLPVADEGADEVLARQVFEHLSMREDRAALDECDRAIRPGGVLRLCVPDHEESLRRLKLTDDPFFARHVLGSRRDEAAYHVMGWTRAGLIALVEEHGFVFDGDEPNPHFYPAICLRFRKPGVRAAWEYVDQTLLAVPDDARVVEFGPGTRPWPRSDVLVDSNQDFLDAAPSRNRLGREVKKILFNLDDIEIGGAGAQTPWGKKEIDFVFAAHVLEHVKLPQWVANEWARIAKRGVVVVPSILKEGLTAFEEGDHLWWSLPPRVGTKALRMVRADYAWREKVADSNASGCLSRIFRTGPFRIDHDARYLRRWWRRVEPALDVVFPWEGECEVETL